MRAQREAHRQAKLGAKAAGAGAGSDDVIDVDAVSEDTTAVSDED